MKTRINDTMDDKLLEKLGITNANPFRVPEGYFDELTARVMKNIPMEEEEYTEKTTQDVAKVVTLNPKKNMGKRILQWTSAAAACFILAFTGIHYLDKGDEKQMAENMTALNMTEDFDDEYAEELISYSNMDEIDVYNYLSGVEY